MEVGDPRKVRYPTSVGLPISPYNLSLFLDHVHTWSGVPHRGGLPGQPSQVTRLAGVSFLHVNARGWGRVMFILACNYLWILCSYTFLATMRQHFKPHPSAAGTGVACEGQVFLTSGRWGTPPSWGPLAQCEQALSHGCIDMIGIFLGQRCKYEVNCSTNLWDKASPQQCRNWD